LTCTGIFSNVIVLVPGVVTEMVMLPLAGGVVGTAAVKPALSESPPSPDRQPIVKLAPDVAMVPMAESAVTATTVPAGMGLPLVSVTV